MIAVKEHIIQGMLAAAIKSWPEECCGLLVGERSVRGDLCVSEIVMSDNCARDKTSGFMIDPAVHINLQRRVRGTASEICGLFHSHPTGRSEPSREDQRAEADHGWIWFIVGTEETRISSVPAFGRSSAGAPLMPVNYEVISCADVA